MTSQGTRAGRQRDVRPSAGSEARRGGGVRRIPDKIESRNNWHDNRKHRAGPETCAGLENDTGLEKYTGPETYMVGAPGIEPGTPTMSR